MSKKKYIIAITSLSLVIVALVGAVVGIWAATQQTVNSKLYVSYTPTKDVIATVSAEYSLAGATASSIGSQSWTYNQATVQKQLDKTNLTLTDTNSYIIFHFTFRNDAIAADTGTGEIGNTQSKYLQIGEQSSPAVSNMTVSKKYVTDKNKIAAPMTTAKFDSATDGGVALLKNIDCGTTIHIYVRVSITTKGKPAYWGSTSNNSFAFTLTAGPTQVT